MRGLLAVVFFASIGCRSRGGDIARDDTDSSAPTVECTRSCAEGLCGVACPLHEVAGDGALAVSWPWVATGSRDEGLRVDNLETGMSWHRGSIVCGPPAIHPPHLVWSECTSLTAGAVASVYRSPLASTVPSLVATMAPASASIFIAPFQFQADGSRLLWMFEADANRPPTDLFAFTPTTGTKRLASLRQAPFDDFGKDHVSRMVSVDGKVLVGIGARLVSIERDGVASELSFESTILGFATWPFDLAPLSRTKGEVVFVALGDQRSVVARRSDHGAVHVLWSTPSTLTCYAANERVAIACVNDEITAIDLGSGAVAPYAKVRVKLWRDAVSLDQSGAIAWMSKGRVHVRGPR